MSDVIQVTTKEDFFAVTDDEKVIVDFARRYGCNPCRQLEPHFALAATKLKPKGYKFVRIHLDEVDAEFLDFVLDELNIKSTPTVLYYSYSGVQCEVKARTAPLITKELSERER